MLHDEILYQHRFCEYIVHVDDAPRRDLETVLTWRNLSEPQIIISDSGTMVHRNRGQVSMRFQPCFLFVHGINARGRAGNAWPEAGPPGGSMYQTFHAFLLARTSMEDLLQFARDTRRIFHAVHVHPYGGSSVNAFKLSGSGSTLELVLSLTSIDAKTASLYATRLFDEEPNLEGTSVHGLHFCGVGGCEEKIEEFKTTGRWPNLFLYTIHQLSQLVNGTMTMSDVFLPPTDGQDEETGEWDEWTQPLVDGSATVSALIRLPLEKSKVVYTTAPAAFDNVVFATTKARKLGKVQSLSKLLAPLAPEVWLCCLISVLALFVTMAFAVAQIPVIRSLGIVATSDQVAAILIKPIVGQPPLLRGSEPAGRKASTRLLLGTWLVALIVLTVGYTSTMTSDIVLPLYEHLPTTFEELANSDFKLFGVYWAGTVEKEFESLNSSLGRQMLSRVMDTDLMNKEVLYLKTIYVFRVD